MANISATTTNNSLYSVYKDAGPSAELISAALAINLAGVPGLVGNAFLCWVTVRNRSLRGTSNWLLVFTALFELLHQSAHFFFLAVTLSGVNFIAFQQCVLLELHSIFGVSAGQMAMLVTAVDRLLCIGLSSLHDRILASGQALYLSVLLLICAIPGIYFALLAWQTAKIKWDTPVTGSIGDLFIGPMEQLFQYLLIVGLLNIGVYVVVWAVVRIKTKNAAAASTNPSARLFRSLAVIICVVLGGYILNNLVHLVVFKVFTLDDIQTWLFTSYSGVILNIGASAEAPILYIFSTDYRKAFTKEFFRIVGKSSTSSVKLATTQVQPIANGSIRSSQRK